MHDLAVRRAEVIGRLAGSGAVGLDVAGEAASSPRSRTGTSGATIGDDNAVRSRRNPLRWRPAPPTTIGMPVALALFGNLATGTIHVTWWWWPLATWVAVAVLVLASIRAERARRRSDLDSVVSDAGVRTLMTTLADEVRRAWAVQAVQRQALPVPLRVRWSSTGRPVAASRAVVLNDPTAGGWQQVPLEGDASEITAKFRDLPHRQLVVIGEPGAGKSVLAMLLTLGLIDHPQPNEPVPVLLSIGSWNPTVENPKTFAIRRLGEDYGFLTQRGNGARSLAEILVDGGRVLPILDGLDEVAGTWHTAAITALDREAATGWPLVVTCRSHEYERMVACNGSVLSQAAVVEIEPVDVERAIDFLSHPDPFSPRWQQVFDHLRAEPDGPLARVLSTPLMVALARTAYQDPTTNPAGLLESTTTAVIRSVLIDGFVASVYHPNWRPPTGHQTRLRTYDPHDAKRWLSVLAYHLYQAGTRDLWWWQLAPGLFSPDPAKIERRVRVLALTASILIGLGAGPVAGWWTATRVAVVVAVILGPNTASVFRSLWRHGFPPHVDLTYRTPHQRRAHRVAMRFSFGSVYGVMSGLLLADPVLAAAGGLLLGVLTVFIPSVSLPSRSRRSTPRATMRANHRNTATAGIQHALTGGLLFAVLAVVTSHATTGVLTAGCVAGLVCGTAAAFGAGLWTATRFRITHLLHAIHHRLPWRLWSFLDDAHQRGTARQAGTAWQFRHALLQDHLAEPILAELLTALADADNRYAAERLAALLAVRGHIEKLHARANAGDSASAVRLAILFKSQRRTEEAIAVLRPLADTNDPWASQMLVRMLVDLRRVDELRDRVDAGTWSADISLPDLLATLGRIDELRDLADNGNPHAGFRLAAVLGQQGDVEQLRTRTNAGTAVSRS